MIARHCRVLDRIRPLPLPGLLLLLALPLAACTQGVARQAETSADTSVSSEGPLPLTGASASAGASGGVGATGTATNLGVVLRQGGVFTDSKGVQWQTQVLRSYVAASGRTCHSVRFVGADMSSAAPVANRVVCEEGGRWVVVPPLRNEIGGPAIASPPPTRVSERPQAFTEERFAG